MGLLQILRQATIHHMSSSSFFTLKHAVTLPDELYLTVMTLTLHRQRHCLVTKKPMQIKLEEI